MNQNPTAEQFRNRLVDQITAQHPLPADVERVLRHVRREAHLPGASLADACRDQAVTIKDNPAGPQALSCASVPTVVAMMLTQLQARSADNVLEIGAGTGYNAALLAELVGRAGHVTTLDIDADVALHARTTLNQAGYPHVQIIHRNGLEGAPENAPYTKIIATVGVWDVPTTWWDQLADGGRLALPLRWRGQTRSVALTRRGDTLISDSVELCGFVPIIGQDGEKTAALNPEQTVRIHYDQDQDQDINPRTLTDLLTEPATEAWSQTRIGGQESFDGIWLRASATDDRVCRIEVIPQAIESGVRRPAAPALSPALVAHGSLAYLILAREGTDPERPFCLGAAGYGPNGPALAQDLITHINTWGTNRTATPQIIITPVKGHTASGTERHIDKQDSRITLSY
ncbi:methyltransferase, FxLD system [Streptomyces sp. KLOTTS4A1]|uniref:methyltransferase, FxLD system n=1 Tax=Streptomyces sp. KLOTTS4A1 TaxID=3390996 RepID=UPI0039F51576